jgi:hypothetical protein
MQIKALAHNLFHKICEELWRRAVRPGNRTREPERLWTVVCNRMGLYQPWRVHYFLRKPDRCACVCLSFERAHLFSLDSSTWGLPAALAHIVFHSLCAKHVGGRGWLILPKICARELFPYESKGLALRCALAHNFVHKKCEEAN